MEKILYLLRGVSGSGKTRLGFTLTDFDLVMSADNWFTDSWGAYDYDAGDLPKAHQYCQDRTHDAMVDGHAKIAVANTFTQEWEMEPYYKFAEEFGYTVFSIIVENRHEGANTHGVPEEIVQDMRERFEVKL
jgi:hypothetical protein